MTDAEVLAALNRTSGPVSDPALGNRTADQTLVNPANTGPLTSVLSWLAGSVKGITGEADWKNVPATTLKTLKTRADAHEGSRDGHPVATTTFNGLMVGADKAKLDNLGGASQPKGHIVDANCVWNTSTSYHVEPGEALVNGALLSWSANIARTGLALVANSAYYVYLFSSAGAAAVEESTVAPVYDISLGYYKKGGTTPDSTRRCIGYFPTGASGAIRRFFCVAIGKTRDMHHILESDDVAPLLLLSGGASTGAWTQVSAGSLLPAHASHGYYAVKINFTGTNEDAVVGISPADLGALVAFVANYTVRDKSTTSKTFFGRAWLPLMGGSIYYRLLRVLGTPTAEIECHGARFGV